MPNTSQTKVNIVKSNKVKKKKLTLTLPLKTPEDEALSAFIVELVEQRAFNSWARDALIHKFNSLINMDFYTPEVISSLASKAINAKKAIKSNGGIEGINLAPNTNDTATTSRAPMDEPVQLTPIASIDVKIEPEAELNVKVEPEEAFEVEQENKEHEGVVPGGFSKYRDVFKPK